MPTDRRREWEAKMEARRNFCLGAVSIYDTAINACKEALVARPDDPALHQAVAAKYRAREMTAAALIAYGNAIERGATDLEVLITEVELERDAQADACLAGGDLPSCDTAVLPGAEDEFDLQRQRGELLLAAGQSEAALEAFSIAQSLEPGNRAVAARLLTLFDALGQRVREDPSRLTARAYALLAAGAELEAMVLRNRIPVLFEDQRMEALGGRLFDAAEQRRDRVVQRDCLQRSDERALIDCRKLLVAELPDRNRIERHIDEVARELERQRVAPVVPEPAALPEPIAAVPDAGGDRAEGQEPRPQGAESVPATVAIKTYSNQLSDNEVTY
jgi:tetratricopeptide (TPR) repeat protein